MLSPLSHVADLSMAEVLHAEHFYHSLSIYVKFGLISHEFYLSVERPQKPKVKSDRNLTVS